MRKDIYIVGVIIIFLLIGCIPEDNYTAYTSNRTKVYDIQYMYGTEIYANNTTSNERIGYIYRFSLTNLYNTPILLKFEEIGMEYWPRGGFFDNSPKKSHKTNLTKGSYEVSFYDGSSDSYFDTLANCLDNSNKDFFSNFILSPNESKFFDLCFGSYPNNNQAILYVNFYLYIIPLNITNIDEINIKDMGEKKYFTANLNKW